MTAVLVTAFESYAPWPENSSWLTLVELARRLPQAPRLVTRRYPVDFFQVPRLLEEDLKQDFDFALHLGQAPGRSRIELEAVGVNVGRHPEQPRSSFPLAEDGPAAYRSPLPLESWAERLRSVGLPAAVSYHAGTYLCNATLYWSRHLAATRGWKMQSLFVHLPLTPSQVVAEAKSWPSLPVEMLERAVRELLAALHAFNQGGQQASA